METEDDVLTLGKPLFLITSTQQCWKCRAVQPVIALASSYVLEDEDTGGTFEESAMPLPSILCDITEMPDNLLSLINSFHAAYRKHASRTARRAYFMNFCECGANFGDHFLFMEPGGAFFPMSKEDAACMTIRVLPVNRPIKIKGTICQGAEDLIFENAQRL